MPPLRSAVAIGLVALSCFSGFLPIGAAVLPASEPFSYRASLHQPGGEASVHGQYIVKLTTGHSPDTHFEAIGANLTEDGYVYLYMPPFSSYLARFEADILEAVRSDPVLNTWSKTRASLSTTRTETLPQMCHA
jgi:hypothetical protein